MDICPNSTNVTLGLEWDVIASFRSCEGVPKEAVPYAKNFKCLSGSDRWLSAEAVTLAAHGWGSHFDPDAYHFNGTI